MRPAWKIEATGPRVFAQISWAVVIPSSLSATLIRCRNFRVFMLARESEKRRSKISQPDDQGEEQRVHGPAAVIEKIEH
jgi:hypothetical protein